MGKAIYGNSNPASRFLSEFLRCEDCEYPCDVGGRQWII